MTPSPMGHLLGREKLLVKLEDAVLRGDQVLLLGPLGIGKTSVLLDIARRMAARNVPCGLSSDTRSLGDVTAALSSAFSGSRPLPRTQRHLRSQLRLAIEARLGVLLLDHVTTATAPMKGFLRSLRGKRLGVVLAADIENRRDHAAVREMHLTHVEIVVPPLARRLMTALLRDLLAGSAIPSVLIDDDRQRLLQFSRGSPGRLVMFADLLADARFWRAGLVAMGSLNEAASELVLQRYLARDASL